MDALRSNTPGGHGLNGYGALITAQNRVSERWNRIQLGKAKLVIKLGTRLRCDLRRGRLDVGRGTERQPPSIRVFPIFLSTVDSPPRRLTHLPQGVFPAVETPTTGHIPE